MDAYQWNHSILHIWPGTTKQIDSSTLLNKFILIHRYTTEIPEPAIFLSGHVAQIGGLLIFSCNQNNRGSSSAYVTCIYCRWSVKINMCKTPHCMWRSWMHLFCICFCICNQQNPQEPQFEPHGWWRHYTGQYMRSGISLVYLCFDIIIFQPGLIISQLK